MDKLFKHNSLIKDVKANDFNFTEDSLMTSKKGERYWLTFGKNPQHTYLYNEESDMIADRDLLIEKYSDR